MIASRIDLITTPASACQFHQVQNKPNSGKRSTACCAVLLSNRSFAVRQYRPLQRFPVILDHSVIHGSLSDPK
jgi:hypothetical protein